MGFFRQEYWSGLPFTSSGDFSDPGIKPRSPTLRADFISSEPPGKSRPHQTWALSSHLIGSLLSHCSSPGNILFFTTLHSWSADTHFSLIADVEFPVFCYLATWVKQNLISYHTYIIKYYKAKYWFLETSWHTCNRGSVWLGVKERAKSLFSKGEHQ